MRQIHPIITTAALQECCEFYQRAFDAQVLFRADWYVQLSVDGWEIGFLKPNAPARLPVFQHSTLTRGLCLALEVADVRAVSEQLAARGVPALGPLRQAANGEWSLSVIDPSGVVLNIVERHTDPADITAL